MTLPLWSSRKGVMWGRRSRSPSWVTRMSTDTGAPWSCVWYRNMWVTPRDLEILARVHAVRACDSAALADLFPTVKALQQRLWRLTRSRFLRVHRVGNQRAYSLSWRGVQALGLSTEEVRISRAAAA